MRNKKMGSYKPPRVLNLPQTKVQSYVKDRQESSSGAIKQNCVESKFFLVKRKMIWQSTVFWWKESFGAWQWQTSCVSLTDLLQETELETNFAREMKTLEGSGWKILYVIIHEFRLETLKVFHSQERGGFTPESVIQFFFKVCESAMVTITIIMQDFIIAAKPTSLLCSTNTR